MNHDQPQHVTYLDSCVWVQVLRGRYKAVVHDLADKFRVNIHHHSVGPLEQSRLGPVEQTYYTRSLKEAKHIVFRFFEDKEKI